MRARTWTWIAVIVVSAGLGVAIAGVPSHDEDVPLRVGSTTAPSTTALTEPAPPTSAPAEPDASAAPPFPGEIRVGATGPGVSQWQQKMHDRGWDLDVDGRYGEGAAETCAKFQDQKGLPSTGIVDQATWEATWTAPLPDDVS